MALKTVQKWTARMGGKSVVKSDVFMRMYIINGLENATRWCLTQF